MRRALLLASLALAGCSLYWDDDHGSGTDAGVDVPEVCGAADGGPAIELRNPDTLECVPFGGGGCPPGCPCPLTGADEAPVPPWGVCGGACDALPEAACLTDPSCRVAYDYACYTGDGPCTALTPFLGCFALSQTAITGACAGLDAWSCSSRNDCLALHTAVCDPSGRCWLQYVECRDEQR